MADHIIKPNIGKVHTVEVHPDIDHLYRAKGLINDNKRPHLHVGDFKRHGFPDDIVKRLPRDGNGKVTPDMIDKHIASLPKHKLDITIHPYERGQQHRTYDANKEIINNEVSWKAPDQYVVSVNRHADTKFGPMSEKLHEISKKHQYKWGNDNNIGWGRIDPHKIDKNGNIKHTDHWHLDEIQSDMQNNKKVRRHIDIKNYKPDDTGEYSDSDIKQYITDLSHGHQDPQHLVHSAVNALARKLGVNSISMNELSNQLYQSGIEIEASGPYAKAPVHFNETYKKRPGKLGAKSVNKQRLLGEYEYDNDDTNVNYYKLHKTKSQAKETLIIHPNGQWTLKYNS